MGEPVPVPGVTQPINSEVSGKDIHLTELSWMIAGAVIAASLIAMIGGLLSALRSDRKGMSLDEIAKNVKLDHRWSPPVIPEQKWAPIPYETYPDTHEGEL